VSLHGVYCAAATPVDAGGAIDRQRFQKHVRTLIADGCNGIALLGTTGEANSFSIAERRGLLEAALEAGIAPAQLMPGSGLCAAPDTIELTRHALSLGVTKVVMLPPFYYKQPSDDGLYAAYARIIDSIGDARLKIVLYHIPQMSAVPLSHALIARLIKAFPDTVVGIKDSSGDIGNMLAMVKAFPGFAVFAGADPLMKPLLEAGGAGCITATSNLIGKELATVFHNFADPARASDVEAAQARIVALRNISNTFVQIPTVKALIAGRYKDDTWTNVRPPLVALNAGQRNTIDAAVAALDGA
jgi:4-hydroxy-tetrahydrodipicolinate synthase